jgi:hypothetical protein
MTTIASPRVESRSLLWRGAGLTAFAALLFPRLNAVMYDDERIWQLDREAMVLAPLVVLVALGVFAAVGIPAWRGAHNRPARAAVVCGVLGVVGVLAYWISAPIILGGLAVTLGVEGRRRAAEGRRGEAVAGIVLGAIGVVLGAVLWFANV